MLKIDQREQKIKDYFSSLPEKTRSFSIEYSQLAHGDFQIWVEGESQPKFLFERKTIEDLMASIKDGRYKNQKSILLQSGYQCHQIYYIIEGNVKWTTSSTQLSVQGAIINTLLRDRMGIFFTRNIEETSELLTMITKRVLEDPSKYSQDSISLSTEKQIVTLTQNDKITPMICFRNMLCQVPGISGKSADAIVDTYHTMKNMISLLSLSSKEEQEKQLNQIKVNGRKISSKIVTNLFTYLL